MHFFEDINSILYLDTSAGRYVCTYNVPADILKKCEGYGNYWDYISFKFLCIVKEFAIPSYLLQFEYLENVDLLTSSIDYEDLLDNKIINLTKRLYKKQKID